MVHRHATLEVALQSTSTDARVLPAQVAAFFTNQQQRIDGADDAQLVELLGLVEQVGRLADSLRVLVAAEVERRSSISFDDDSLANRHGCRNATELVQRVTGASAVTVSRRIRLGRRLACETTLAGETVPVKFPNVASTLKRGRIGFDAASAIVTVLGPLLERVSAVDDRAFAPTGSVLRSDFSAAEVAVTALAEEFHADDVRLQAEVWRAAIDPDGAALSDQQAMAKRFLRLGKAKAGMIPIRGMLMPEVAASLQRQLDAHLSPRRAPTFIDTGTTETSAARDSAQGAGDATDPRSFDQRRHDVLASILDTAARSADAPSIGGAPPTVIVSVQSRDLERGSGVGQIDGASEPVSMAKVRAYACDGGVQRIVMNQHGGVVSMSSPQRTFTSQQRRAITVRDGGCVIPGCTIPAAWCEIHHVRAASEGGPTTIANGVSLCWFHHRSIETSGWKISMRDGVPWLKAPPWLDPIGHWRPSSKSRIRIAMRI